MDELDERYNDLFWHALNYRTAASEHAQDMWLELEACVDRLVEAGRDAEAELANGNARLR